MPGSSSTVRTVLASRTTPSPTQRSSFGLLRVLPIFAHGTHIFVLSGSRVCSRPDWDARLQGVQQSAAPPEPDGSPGHLSRAPLMPAEDPWHRPAARTGQPREGMALPGLVAASATGDHLSSICISALSPSLSGINRKPSQASFNECTARGWDGEACTSVRSPNSRCRQMVGQGGAEPRLCVHELLPLPERRLQAPGKVTSHVGEPAGKDLDKWSRAF